MNPSTSRSRLLSSILAAALISSLSGCSRTLSWTTLAGQAGASSSGESPPPAAPATGGERSAEGPPSVETPRRSEPEQLSEASPSPPRDRYAPEDEPAPSFASPRRPQPQPSPAPAASTAASVRLRSSCAQTVQLVLAGRSHETTIRLDPNEVESRSLDVDGRIWLLDAAGSKLSSLEVTASLREVMVGADCLSVLSV